jgi:hypothetical protein
MKTPALIVATKCVTKVAACTVGYVDGVLAYKEERSQWVKDLVQSTYRR